MKMITLEEIGDFVGKEIAVSGWTLVDQARIDQFAKVTDDCQFIHVDPDRAANAGFGGTIAHGFLTMSLLSKFAGEASLKIENTVMTINYGFNRLRNIAPVPCNSRVRGRFHLKEFQRKNPQRILLNYETQIEIAGNEKPAVLAEWLILHELGDQPAMV
jgi:acyl dehydratase